jgi:Trk K+ transport system NAD-binding subunit
MKVAVAGGGSVGMAVAADLKVHGHDVFILEVDPEQVARFQPHVDVRWLVADACEVSSLKAAGMDEVDVMVAATGDDEDNLVISLLSKQEFAVPRVIARVNNASNQWLFTESWGVDVPVSTPQLYTALVEEAVSIGSLVHLMSFEGASAHRTATGVRDRRHRPPGAHDHPRPGDGALPGGRGDRPRHGRERARDSDHPGRRRASGRPSSDAGVASASAAREPVTLRWRTSHGSAASVPRAPAARRVSAEGQASNEAKA